MYNSREFYQIHVEEEGWDIYQYYRDRSRDRDNRVVDLNPHLYVVYGDPFIESVGVLFEIEQPRH